MLKKIVIAFIFGVIFISAANAQADGAGLRKSQFNLEKGLAIKGYDPVAYHTLKKAVEGSNQWVVSHQGVIYHFANEANKKLFVANPSAYEPAYGGWCAYAMGNDGEKVSIDPETFKLVNGKLYLFYNRYFTNTLKYWNKQEGTLRTKADANWKKFYH